MPTLVWVHRSQIVACAAAAAAAKRDGNNAASAAAAVPDPDGGSAGKASPVVSASADRADPPTGGPLPAVSSSGGTKRGRKRKCSEAEAATAGKTKSKVASAERDLPRGVYRTKSGKFHTRLQWGDKQRHIGMLDTSEQASAARMSVRKYYLDDANVAPCGASEVDAVFDAAKTKALESVMSGYVTRDLPRGVSKSKSGKLRVLDRLERQKPLHWYV